MLPPPFSLFPLVATGIFTKASIQKAADQMWESASPDLRKDYGREHFDERMKLMQSYASKGVRMAEGGGIYYLMGRGYLRVGVKT